MARSVLRGYYRPVRRPTILVLAALVTAIFGAAPAEGSRSPSRAEAKAIKAAFLKGRSKSATRLRRIRVSTVDSRFAAVSFTADLRQPSAAKVYKPAPVILKKAKGGKWKPVSKAPVKVVKDLKATAKSAMNITGEVNASLTQPASCTSSRGFYSASIYDRGSDTYLSVQINRYTGPGWYPALAVRSLAALSVGNMGGPPQWETGQGNNAEAPSGSIYVDNSARWGLVLASMARVPDASTYPQSVEVNGSWACR